MKKTVISFFLAVVMMAVLPLMSVAADVSTNPFIETFDDGSYIVHYEDGATLTVSAPRIPDHADPDSTKGTLTVITRSIDATYRDSDGDLEWKYTLTGTFSYTYGVSSTCTSATYSQNIYQGSWEFSDGAATASGNQAHGTGTYKQKLLFITIRTVNVNLLLTCDKYGVVS